MQKQTKTRIGVSEITWLAIRNMAVEHSWVGDFEVTGYTSFQKILKDCDDTVTFMPTSFFMAESGMIMP